MASLSSDRNRTTLTFAWDARFFDDPDICVSTGRVTLYLEGKHTRKNSLFGDEAQQPERAAQDAEF